MEGANEAARRAVNGILQHAGSDAAQCRIWNLHEPELLTPWRANDRERYRQGLPWDDTAARMGLSALAALQRGATALEATIMSAMGSAMHVEDLLSFVRTGESRSDLMERLTSGLGAPSGELLRAFADLAQVGSGPAMSSAASTLATLTGAGRAAATRPDRDRPSLRRATDMSAPVRSITETERRLAEYRDLTYNALLEQLPTPGAAPLSVRPDRGRARARGQGPAARALHRQLPRLRWIDRASPAVGRRRSSCSTTRSSSTTTSRTAACTAATRPRSHGAGHPARRQRRRRHELPQRPRG